MQLRSSNSSRRILAALLAVIFLLSGIFPSLAQDDSSSTGSPLQRALRVAREVIEEERGSPLTMVKWRFYEDDWSSLGSQQLYGSFGIDNCSASVPIMLKRGQVLFGWTFSILDVSGKEYQARVSNDLRASVICDEVHVPPAYASSVAPDPAASEPAADAPAPVVGAANVAGFALGGQVVSLDGSDINMMRSAGMTWIKLQLPHSADIGTGKQWINNVHANGFKILLSVPGDHNALATEFDSYVARYAAFLGELAAAGADAIEVWNEPNLDREWPAGQINGANYTRLLQPAYNAIKGSNSATLVISAAPAPTGYAGNAGCIPTVCNDDVFMQQMANAGAGNYMDCLGLHYNEGVVSPNANSGDATRNYYPTLYFSQMLDRGAQYFPGKSVCWTELGYLSGQGFDAPIPEGFRWANGVSVAQQATWLAEAASLSANDSRVSLMIVWNFNYSLWGDDPQGGYAIVRPDGSCPACNTLGNVMSGG